MIRSGVMFKAIAKLFSQSRTVGADAAKYCTVIADGATASWQNEIFQDGIHLESGSVIPWSRTRAALLGSDLLSKDQRNGYPVYVLKEKVRVGPYLIPNFFFYESSEDENWIVEAWHFEFTEFSPAQTADEIKAHLSLMSNQEWTWFRDSPFDCLIYNTGFQFKLADYSGVWGGTVTLESKRYWSIMRSIHPMTLRLSLSKVAPVKVESGSTRYVPFGLEGKFQKFPTPEKLSDHGLSFWTDEPNQLQGISCFDTSIYWSTGDFVDIQLAKELIDGERGSPDYEVHILRISLADSRKVILSFNEIGPLDLPSISQLYGVRV